MLQRELSDVNVSCNFKKKRFKSTERSLSESFGIKYFWEGSRKIGQEEYSGVSPEIWHGKQEPIWYIQEPKYQPEFGKLP